jgi:hypothetical protein
VKGAVIVLDKKIGKDTKPEEGTVAVKGAVIVLGRRGGIRGRVLAPAPGLDPSITSHQTILIAGGAETSMVSSPPQNSCDFIAISYPS